MPSLLVNVLIVQYGQWEKCAIKYKVHIVITEFSTTLSGDFAFPFSTTVGVWISNSAAVNLSAAS